MSAIDAKGVNSMTFAESGEAILTAGGGPRASTHVVELAMVEAPIAGSPAAVSRAARPAMRWTPGRVALLAGVVLYLSVALLVPLGALALEAVRTGLGNIVRELLTPEA